jgi:hypothetical protein
MPGSPAAEPLVVDVIVIGGGLSGGLPAAAYLQKAGLQVLVVEANAELGSFCCTHETWPQTLDSPHVGVSFAGNSPVIADLDLERYGEVASVLFKVNHPGESGDSAGPVMFALMARGMASRSPGRRCLPTARHPSGGMRVRSSGRMCWGWRTRCARIPAR